MDIAKVDRDVAYVAMVVHICCKLPFPMFHLCFSYVCYKCVNLDVAYAGAEDPVGRGRALALPSAADPLPQSASCC